MQAESPPCWHLPVLKALETAPITGSDTGGWALGHLQQHLLAAHRGAVSTLELRVALAPWWQRQKGRS